jgi:hypothetical protein
VKKNATKNFGDKKLETEGNAKITTGKLHNPVGGLKHFARSK